MHILTTVETVVMVKMAALVVVGVETTQVVAHTLVVQVLLGKDMMVVTEIYMAAVNMKAAAVEVQVKQVAQARQVVLLQVVTVVTDYNIQ